MHFQISHLIFLPVLRRYGVRSASLQIAHSNSWQGFHNAKIKLFCALCAASFSLHLSIKHIWIWVSAEVFVLGSFPERWLASTEYHQRKRGNSFFGKYYAKCIIRIRKWISTRSQYDIRRSSDCCFSLKMIPVHIVTNNNNNNNNNNSNKPRPAATEWHVLGDNNLGAFDFLLALARLASDPRNPCSFVGLFLWCITLLLHQDMQSAAAASRLRAKRGQIVSIISSFYTFLAFPFRLILRHKNAWTKTKSKSLRERVKFRAAYYYFLCDDNHFFSYLTTTTGQDPDPDESGSLDWTDWLGGWAPFSTFQASTDITLLFYQSSSFDVAGDAHRIESIKNKKTKFRRRDWYFGSYLKYLGLICLMKWAREFWGTKRDPFTVLTEYTIDIIRIIHADRRYESFLCESSEQQMCGW